jgi:hypothetical protein
MWFVWVLAAVGLFLFAQWLNTFLRQNFNLPNDMQMLIVLAFTGILGILMFASLWTWRSDKPPTNQVPTSVAINVQAAPAPKIDALTQFEQETYPDLANLRQSMLQQLQSLQGFFAKVLPLGEQMPHQRPFLQRIVDNRWARKTQLTKAYQNIDKSRRTFWMYYQTGENQYVRKMFDNEANRLKNTIQDALGESLKSEQAEQVLVNEQIDKASQQLKQNKLPKTNKAPFQPYTDANSQLLAQWLNQQQESTILIALNQLRQEESKIRERIRYVQAYQRTNPDLREQVNTLLSEWQNALIYNQYAQYRLLFAVETLVITQQIGYSADLRPLVGLRTEARSQAPELVNQAIEVRSSAEYSYQPEIERKYRSKNSAQY